MDTAHTLNGTKYDIPSSMELKWLQKLIYSEHKE